MSTTLIILNHHRENGHTLPPDIARGRSYVRYEMANKKVFLIN